MGPRDPRVQPRHRPGQSPGPVPRGSPTTKKQNSKGTLMKPSSSRTLLKRSLVAAVAAGASLALASPAHAVEYPAYRNKANNQCLQGTSSDAPVLSYACDNGSDQVLAYVAACGGDPEEWERRWQRAAQEEAAQPPGDDGAVAPYRGLARYEPGDRDRFFGRERLVGELAELAQEHRFAGVVGTSGSGKSSLLRAGLIPALQEKTSPVARPAAIRILTPGEHPATAHAHALIPVEGDADTWVVVDQFEEVFALCQDPVQRTTFIDLLLTALRPGSRLRVVIAVRADFYGHCADHRALADALREANLLVGPMNADELREAIVKPAAAAGLVLERALTAKIISDVADQPGALPLMSHALLETWRRRRGRTLTLTLTLKGYDAVGGIHGAIAHTAEDLYTRLSPEQAGLASRLLLRLNHARGRRSGHPSARPPRRALRRRPRRDRARSGPPRSRPAGHTRRRHRRPRSRSSHHRLAPPARLDRTGPRTPAPTSPAHRSRRHLGPARPRPRSPLPRGPTGRRRGNFHPRTPHSTDRTGEVLPHHQPGHPRT